MKLLRDLRYRSCQYRLSAIGVAVFELLRVNLQLRSASIEDLLGNLGARSLPADNWKSEDIDCPSNPQMAAAVRRAAKLFPKPGSTCLITSCALANMRRYCGMASILLIGFKPDPEGRILGHAWIRAGNLSLDADHIVTAAFRIDAK